MPREISEHAPEKENGLWNRTIPKPASCKAFSYSVKAELVGHGDGGFHAGQVVTVQVADEGVFTLFVKGELPLVAGLQDRALKARIAAQGVFNGGLNDVVPHRIVVLEDDGLSDRKSVG